MNGDYARESVGEHGDPTPGIGTRIGMMALNTTYGPTANHIATFNTAEDQLASIKSDLKQVTQNELTAIATGLKNAGAPWIEGEGLIED